MPIKDISNVVNELIKMHITCIVIEGLIEIFTYYSVNESDTINPYRYSYLTKILQLIKMFIYFLSIVWAQ